MPKKTLKIDTTIFDKKITGFIEPKIYAFKTAKIPNYLKVGDTYRPVAVRINEWKSIYGNTVVHKNNWEWPAKIDNKCYFRDFEVHSYLLEKNKKRLQPNKFKNTPYSKEFFLNATPSNVSDAIKDIKKAYGNHSHKYSFYNLEDKHSTEYHYERNANYPLRPNQKETVRKFVKARNKGIKNLLMFAVMRFGKSFTAMQCALKMKEPKAKFVLIVSGKADVREEWKKTIETHVDFAKYKFLDKEDLIRDGNIIKKTLSSSDNQNRVAVFVTLQDLLGEKIKEKHREIFSEETPVDLLIVDETHFAAWSNKTGEVLRPGDINEKLSAEEKDTVQDALEFFEKKKIVPDTTLHLSGTPYWLIYSGKFSKDSIIAFYQFSDIKKDQKAWIKEHINKIKESEDKETDDSNSLHVWDNPYYGFPEMIRFAFNPSEKAKEKLKKLKKSRRLASFFDFFETQSLKKDGAKKYQKFIHEDIVIDFLSIIDGCKKDQNIFGFLNYEKIKQGKMCRHIVMVLPYRSSCDAMETLLNKHSGDFINLNKYKIFNISGHNQKREFNEPVKIQEGIRECELNNTPTITLTVSRLLTGTTVPQWDTMIYLKDTSSPQSYDQAVYRIQSQFVKNYINVDDAGKKTTIKVDMKPQTLLVDFKPERMFYLQGKSSRIHDVGTNEAEDRDDLKRIEEDLNNSNIYIINSNKLVQVKPQDIMDVLTKYSFDRGIFNEVDDIPVDMSLKNCDAIVSVIDKLPAYNSKEGIQISATESGIETDLDLPEKQEEESSKSNTVDNTTEEENDNSELTKDEFIKKCKTLYTRLLYYSFLTNDNVYSLNKLIESLKGEDNKRIAKNLYIDIDFLKLFRDNLATPVLNQINNGISNINRLTNDTKIPKIKRALTVIKQLSRISKSEVKTPDTICSEIVKLFSDDFIRKTLKSNYKFLDIASKTGEFALALYERFNKLHINDRKIKNSIYSIPTSSMTYEFTLKFYNILGLNPDNIASNFTTADLLEVKKADDSGLNYEHIVKALSQYRKFKDIKLTDEIKGGKKMIKFNAVVGNPPYQKAKGSGGNNDAPMYQEFYNISKALNPEFFSLIIKSAWFSTGRENLLGEFRKDMMNSRHIKNMNVYSDSSKVFPGDVEIEGGVCYFLYDSKNSHKKCNYVLDDSKIIKRDLSEFKQYNAIIQNPTVAEIVKTVLSHFDSETKTVDQIISNDTPFGIPSNPKSSKKNPIKVYKESSSAHNTKLFYIENRVRKIEYVDGKSIVKNKEFVAKDKVFITGGYGSSGSKPHSVIGLPEIAPKNSVCSQSYLFAAFNNNEEASNFYKYLKTRFLRILVSAIKITQSSPQNVYRFVPIEDFSRHSAIFYDSDGNERTLNEIDTILYKKYGLDKFRKFIEETVKEPS